MDRLRKAPPLVLQHLSKSASVRFSLDSAHIVTIPLPSLTFLRPLSVKCKRVVVSSPVLPVLSRLQQDPDWLQDSVPAPSLPPSSLLPSSPRVKAAACTLTYNPTSHHPLALSMSMSCLQFAPPLT